MSEIDKAIMRAKKVLTFLQSEQNDHYNRNMTCGDAIRLDDTVTDAEENLRYLQNIRQEITTLNKM